MDYLQILVKPTTSGVAGALFSYLLMEGSDSIIVMDRIIPGYVLVGVVVAGSAFLAEFAKEWLAPYIGGMKYANFEISIVEPTVTGLSTYVLLMWMDKSDFGNFLPAFLLGAGSNIVGDYTYNHWVKNWA